VFADGNRMCIFLLLQSEFAPHFRRDRALRGAYIVPATRRTDYDALTGSGEGGFFLLRHDGATSL
jgi:hypothetical protein